MSKDTLKLHLTDFDGPLELLLHLIKEAQMDIYDINIKDITNQYFQYLQQMKQMQLEIAGSFFVMAANLMRIKSQWLLAEEIDDGEPEEDPREDLVNQLLEYRRYQKAAHTLHQREQHRHRIYSVPAVQSTNDVEIQPNEFEVASLVGTWQRIWHRHRRTAVGPVNQIEEWQFRISTQAAQIVTRLNQTSNRRLAFSELYAPTAGLEEVVTDFLALLTLVKRQLVRVTQPVGRNEIMIEGDNARDEH
ncbi:segregation/condensation protein A [Fructilactobacillus ixorae]|uniref:Segregation and condensation protein A n=1 Tax=Fructilactobacillus ixorae TaxID=1750535 RepID=A0ABY5C2U6_9LACO|nr:segregation/condensation protein A [Fructilactobacillus ixorae]USS92756.1 segregation/condensation protein A [Fructilactobacillus ixorae]